MTTSSGTSIHTQVRLTGGLPVRFARRGAPAPGEPVPAPASTINGGEDCEALVERGRRMVRGTVRVRAATIGRSDRRKRGRGDQSRRAPVRYPRLRQPDGTRVRRPHRQPQPGCPAGHHPRASDALKHEGGTLDTYLANYGLFHLEADLRWIDMTAARLDALAREVRK